MAHKSIALHDHPDMLDEVRKAMFQLDALNESIEGLRKQDEALRKEAEKIQKQAEVVKRTLMKLIRQKFDLPRDSKMSLDLDYVKQFGLAFLNIKVDEDEKIHDAAEGGIVITSGDGSGLGQILSQLMGQLRKDDDDDDDDRGPKLN